MKYFTIEELCKSYVAEKANIDNTPNTEVRTNLTYLIDQILDPLREAYGKAIVVNSGYRCPELNKKVGGVRNSHHMCLNGYAAADITTLKRENNKILFELAQKLNLPFCQLINESDYSWIHISYNKSDIRRQVLDL